MFLFIINKTKKKINFIFNIRFLTQMGRLRFLFAREKKNIYIYILYLALISTEPFRRGDQRFHLFKYYKVIQFQQKLIRGEIKSCICNLDNKHKRIEQFSTEAYRLGTFSFIILSNIYIKFIFLQMRRLSFDTKANLLHQEKANIKKKIHQTRKKSERLRHTFSERARDVGTKVLNLGCERGLS